MSTPGLGRGIDEGPPPGLRDFVRAEHVILPRLAALTLTDESAPSPERFDAGVRPAETAKLVFHVELLKTSIVSSVRTSASGAHEVQRQNDTKTPAAIVNARGGVWAPPHVVDASITT